MRQILNVCALVLVMIGAEPALAIDFEKLLMPGDVIEGHAKYEGECTKCHERFSKKTQTQLCSDCHEKIDNDIFEKKGFHGKEARVSKVECRVCHTEHKGRDANIVHLNKDTFDHKLTDFKLKGSHTAVACESCHKPKKLYREAPLKCYSCHKKDDVHDGSLGKKCQDCHTEKSWVGKNDFDHGDTDFPLKGKHEKVDCVSCHLNQDYKETPDSCYGCHSVDDNHNGRYGKKCKDCHSEKDWEKIHFNHDKDTDYRITGKHKRVSCDSCHTGHLYKQELETECYSCHKADDEHQGKNGKECDSCHNTKDWGKSTFDHEKETDFPLRGKHDKLICSACHKGEVFEEELKMECYACHRQDDIHAGEQGKDCARCHNETGWQEKIVFDHDLTHFPLIGLHATTPCEECHLSGTYKDAALECIACHKKEDVHKKALGNECEVCHNPNAWSLWEFDHNEQTDFELDGKHEGLGCHLCHSTVLKKGQKTASQCGDCHWSDDIHRGGFGRNCERCHDTESFSDPKITQ